MWRHFQVVLVSLYCKFSSITTILCDIFNRPCHFHLTSWIFIVKFVVMCPITNYLVLSPRVTTLPGFPLTGEGGSFTFDIVFNFKTSCSWFIQPFICSFIGNPGLCGNWLNLPCHGARPSERGKLNFLAGISCFLLSLSDCCFHLSKCMDGGQ